MPAPTFPANAHRYDPYRTFKFQVVIGGQTVAGLSKMGALKRTTESVKWRNAGDPSYQRNIPGGSSFEAVALEQGLSHDPLFQEWANAVNNVADGDAGMSLVTNSIHEPGVYSSGTGAMSNAQWRKNAVRFKQLDDMARRLARLEKRDRQG